jgi:AcrR family transcriptional regulator
MRKEPRQARSRATTEAILEATARILGRRGWDGLTTNEVAEVAGVSIGSLYQYFPNKLALVEAVRRRHFEDILVVLRNATGTTQPRARRIEAFVDAMIAVHSHDPAVHHVLLEEAPRSRASRAVHDAFETEYLSRYQALIGRSNAAAAQVLSSAIAGVIHDAVRLGNLRSPPLRRELIRLVTAYSLRPQNQGKTR